MALSCLSCSHVLVPWSFAIIFCSKSTQKRASLEKSGRLEAFYDSTVLFGGTRVISKQGRLCDHLQHLLKKSFLIWTNHLLPSSPLDELDLSRTLKVYVKSAWRVANASTRCLDLDMAM